MVRPLFPGGLHKDGIARKRDVHHCLRVMQSKLLATTPAASFAFSFFSFSTNGFIARQRNESERSRYRGFAQLSGLREGFGRTLRVLRQEARVGREQVEGPSRV